MRTLRFAVLGLAVLACGCDVIFPVVDKECPSGQRRCGDERCHDVRIDNAHCGQCGHACELGQVCRNGVCALICPEGLKDCEGFCRNTESDNNHCGSCGKACIAGRACSGGTCVVTCQGGLTNCNGVCRDLNTDEENCGMCGRPCSPGQWCESGTCHLSCQSNLTDCSGQCRYINGSDNANCGGCGVACPPEDAGVGVIAFCRLGQCVYPDLGIQIDAGVIDLKVDPKPSDK